MCYIYIQIICNKITIKQINETFIDVLIVKLCDRQFFFFFICNVIPLLVSWLSWLLDCIKLNIIVFCRRKVWKVDMLLVLFFFFFLLLCFFFIFLFSFSSLFQYFLSPPFSFQFSVFLFFLCFFFFFFVIHNIHRLLCLDIIFLLLPLCDIH